MTHDPGFLTTMLLILVSAAVTDNILLTRFLGMCSFIAISREVKTSVGLGVAVCFTTTCTAGLNSLLYHYALLPLSRMVPPGYDHAILSLQLLLFIVVIAGFVQIVEMIVERYSPKLYFALGIYLPLITVNCAILGVCLFMVNKGYGVLQSVAFGFGSGLGWLMAIVLMAGIQDKVQHSRVPAALRGPGITLIVSGIMALAFMGFTGIIRI
ncbi:MAG TPA: Rnf-Nqr domain containing protein [Candidatus Brocadiia bacterium]|nr:Rnf-Nqr domain containing protein [Candidatus Brocadiia bacterium]